MAELYATKNGTWSDVTLWNTSTLPTSSDVVYADGRTVIIDTLSASANIITTASRPGGTAGGRFYINTGVSLSANILTGTTTVLIFNSAAPNFFNLTGNVSGGDFVNGIFNQRGGNIAITGNIKKINPTSTGTTTQAVINHNNGGILYLNGNIEVTDVIGQIINNAAPSTMHCFKTMLFTPSISSINLPNTINIINNTGTLYLTSFINTDLLPANQFINVVNNTGSLYISGTVFETFTNLIRCIVTSRSAGQPGYTYLKGDVLGNTGSNSDGASVIVTNGYLDLIGNVYGANFGGASNAIFCNGTSFVNITGDIYGGNAARGVTLENSTFLYLKGNAYGNGNVAIFNGNSTTATCTAVLIRAKGGKGGGLNPIDGTSSAIFTEQNCIAFIDELEYGDQGATPAAGQVYFTNKPSSVIIMRGVGPSFTPTTFIGSISAENLFPPASSVRSGLIYGKSNRIGTLEVPPASEISFGVPFDNNRLGKYVVGADKFWTVKSNTSAFLAKYTVGYRVRNLLTTPAAGQILNTFNLSGFPGEY